MVILPQVNFKSPLIFDLNTPKFLGATLFIYAILEQPYYALFVNNLIAGNSLPSRNSNNAPPAVDT